jgi:rSAM/selenodomain-associated transferase 1
VRKRHVKVVPRLILFAQVPRSGQVKLRLAEVVGKGRAAEIYRAMLSGFVARLRSLRRKWKIEIHYTPADQEALIIPEVPPGLARVAQAEGDLGARLTVAFTQAFSTSRDPVLIGGTDCPDLPIQYMEEACEKLSAHDVALGPAREGGLYLVGLRRPIPQLFEGIDWSARDVFRLTLQKAKSLGLSCYVAPEWGEVETFVDVQGMLERDASDPRTAKIQNRIRAALQGFSAPAEPAAALALEGAVGSSES